jgi:glutamine amidotransferase/cyclase
MSGLVVIDFGAGNVASMVKALKRVGGAPTVVTGPQDVAAAERIVFPGVGHFGAAMRELRARSMDKAILDAIARSVPILAVCIGLQVLFEGSAEAPGERGLGVFAGACRRFADSAGKVPQIGWNQVKPRSDAKLFRGIEPSSSVYFIHSYYAVPGDPSIVAATAEYGVDYCCAVERGRLAATQFHPEKSGPVGLKVLENFLLL